MLWIKRLLIFLSGMVLTMVLVVAGSLIFIDDEGYRDALVWAVHRFFDCKLEISGPLTIELGKEIAVTAGTLQLRANDGSYRLDAAEFSTRFQLAPMLRKTLYINTLILSGVELEIQAREDTTGVDMRTIRIPPVIIREARLNDLNMVYSAAAPGKAHRIVLHELVIDDINDTGPVHINGKGLLEGREFTLAGQVKPLAEVIASDQPYPLEVSFSSGTFKGRLHGSIEDPFRGKGLDLQLAIEDPKLTETLRLLDEDAPATGSVTAHTRIRGDYAAPALQEIKLHLQHGEALDFRVEGEIANLLVRDRMRFHVAGHSSDPQLTSWLLFGEDHELKSIQASGTLQAEPGRYRVTDLDLKGVTHAGFDMHITGSADVAADADSQVKPESDMRLRFTTPSTTALDYLGITGLPELGAVRGTAAVVPTLDGTRLENIRLEAGRKDHLFGTARGSIDKIPWSIKEITSGFDMQLDIIASRTSNLDELFGYGFPELGPVHVASHVTGSMIELRFDNFRINVGALNQPTIKASGSIDTRLRKHTSTMEIAFEVATADLIAAFAEIPRGYLGRLEGNVTLSDVDGSWGLDQFRVVSTQTNLFQLEIAGALDDVVKRDQGRIRTRMVIDEPTAFGKALGYDLSGLSPYRETGILTIKDDRLNYQSSEQLGNTIATTNLTGAMVNGKPDLRGTISIPVLHLGDIGLAPDQGQERDDKPAGKRKARKADTSREHKDYLFSRKPLKLDWLHILNLDIDYRIDAVAGSKLSFSELQAKISLQDGLLRVSPARLLFVGGPSTLEFELDARELPVFHLKFNGDDVTLGPALAQVQGKVPVDGYANLHIDIRGRGHSMHELAAGLEGTTGLALENVRIPRAYVEYLSVDVFGWALRKATRKGEHADIDCIMGEFEISGGVIQSNLLVVDGPHLAMKGNMTMDLGEETIDMVLLPKKKKRLFTNVTPVHVKGPLRDPRVKAIPARSAAASIGPLVLIPTIAIPTIVAGKLWQAVDDKDKHGGGCAALVKQAQLPGR